ncbi:hypothetical protein AB0L71_32060 [Streptomyces sp. NPDC052052]|uniref:hypothetical protein n=1 Tax=Streptomyces sp. NPDC052052 TaxID=3154756 RepID=UPI0034395B98
MPYEYGADPPASAASADARLERFPHTGDRRDPDQVVEWYRAALRRPLTPADRRNCESNLPVGPWLRWRVFGDALDRDELIALTGSLAAGKGAAEQDLVFLGVALGDRFDRGSVITVEFDAHRYPPTPWADEGVCSPRF